MNNNSLFNDMSWKKSKGSVQYHNVNKSMETSMRRQNSSESMFRTICFQINHYKLILNLNYFKEDGWTDNDSVKSR